MVQSNACSYSVLCRGSGNPLTDQGHRHTSQVFFLGICNSSKHSRLPHGQAGQTTGEGPLLKCGILRYGCSVGSIFPLSTRSHSGDSLLAAAQHGEHSPLCTGTVCQCCEGLYVTCMPGSGRRLLPSIFCITLYSRAVAWELTMSFVCRMGHSRQPAADGDTQRVPWGPVLYLTEQVMTLTVFFPVEVNSNQSSGILGMSHLCTEQHRYFGN